MSSKMLYKFWTWTTQTRPHWRDSRVEAAVLFCVFGVTGSSSVALVRPFLRESLGIHGTMMDGPNSYRLMSFFMVTPIYVMVLLTVGTLAGRHTYFANMARKILGRFVPLKEIKSKIACKPALEKLAKSVKDEVADNSSRTLHMHRNSS